MAVAGTDGLSGASGLPTAPAPTPVRAAPAHPAGRPVTTTVPACQAAPLRDRAGEVLIVGLPGVTEASHPLVDEVLSLGVGGVLVTGANVQSRPQVTRLAADLRRRARHPLVVSTDEESGRVSSFNEVLGRTRSARRLASEDSPAAVRQFARQMGAGLAAMGIDLDLAPVADLDAGPRGGIVGDRSFSADPGTTGRYALAFAAGLTDAGVRATAKHFPGHGPASGDDHTSRVTATLTLEDLTATHLEPFAALVDAGIPVVMMSNVDYAALDPDLPGSLSPKGYELLRRMGFRGVAITDSVGMAAVNQRWDVAQAAVRAIEAGADGVLATDGAMAKHMVHALVVAVQKGELSERRLNQAAGRMLALAGGDPSALACERVEVPRLTTDVGAQA
jgi:beta-N-acetylhexosaminidase